MYTYRCIQAHILSRSSKVKVKIDSAAFDIGSTPVSGDDKPAGAVVIFPRPKGSSFLRDVKFTIKILKSAQMALNKEAVKRRALSPGEVELDEHEMKNTYLEDGTLMWRGARYIQVRAEEIPMVVQACFDLKTKVRSANRSCVVHGVCRSDFYQPGG